MQEIDPRIHNREFAQSSNQDRSQESDQRLVDEEQSVTSHDHDSDLWFQLDNALSKYTKYN